MKISKVRIENFRCIRELDVNLDDTTVFIGANNSGKTAILEAVRIALSRRWGRRGLASPSMTFIPQGKRTTLKPRLLCVCS